MQTTKPPNHQTTKLLASLPYVLIFAVIFMMNFWQLPVADEWEQFRGNKGVEILIEDIVSTYMNWNARIGEMIFKFFMTIVSDDIFVMQKIFGVINTFVFMILLFNVFFIAVGRYPDFKDTKDSVMFLFTFIFMHFSSDFNTSFIWQAGALGYGWAMCFYSCFAVPYRKFFDYTFKSKKEITVFNLVLQYEEGYFSLREIIKGLLFFIISIPIGMGAETTTPVILIGLAIYTIYLVFVKKVIPPLWFFMGGIGLFVGWLLLFFAPGPRKRNAKSPYYVPIHEQKLLTILGRFAFYCHYTYVYINFIAMGVLLVINKKDNKKIFSNPFFLGSLILFFCGVGAGSLLSHIPRRTFITFTIFLTIANLMVLSSLVQKYTKQFLILGMLVVVSISSYELVEYYRFNTLLNGYFSYIVEQRDAGIKDIKIYTKRRKDFIVKTEGFYSHRWVQKPLARYFGVDNIEFFDKDTGESYITHY